MDKKADNIRVEDGSFVSSDGLTAVKYRLYRAAAPRAVLQIVHGMAEYFGRYDAFARYLASSGVSVVGCDQLGHGSTAASDADLGYFTDYVNLIDDQRKLVELTRKVYRSLPYVLMGHSMGSFVARAYLARCCGDGQSGAVDGAVICGTAGKNPNLGAGLTLAKMVKFFRGGHYRSSLLSSASFGAYAKAVPGPTHFEWLSRDEENVRRYVADRLCGYNFTASGYVEMFRLLDEISRDDWAPKVPKNLPILIMSGAADPVGDFSDGPQEVYKALADAECSDVRLRLYENDRHEILNEVDRAQVWADVLAFVTEVADGVIASRTVGYYDPGYVEKGPDVSDDEA